MSELVEVLPVKQTAEFQCPLCSFTSSSINLIKNHFQRVHNYSTCPYCGEYMKNPKIHYLNRGVVSDRHAILYFLSTSHHRLNKRSELAKKVYKRGEKLYLEKYGGGLSVAAYD